jgi:hypothetical protein
MAIFVATFIFFLIVMAIMSIGVIFGRTAIKGSCGGNSSGACGCAKKCAKRLKAEQAG